MTRRFDTKIIILIVIGVVLIAGVALWVGFSYFNDHEYTVTVIRTERVNYNADGKYLIYCENEDGDAIVFENTDNWLRGKINSSDMYARIKENVKYSFRVIGFRFSLFNWYENIIELTEL